MWTVLQRNRKLVPNCTITETRNEHGQRRFSATIDGWRNWRILTVTEPFSGEEALREVTRKVSAIKERIDQNDESVFDQVDQAW